MEDEWHLGSPGHLVVGDSPVPGGHCGRQPPLGVRPQPLYTLWRTGTVGEIVSAALHCTGGDVLIATASLVLALIAVGSSAWPRERFLPVVVAAMVLGLGYTAFSEWLNIEVRRTWAYSDLMPVLPWLGTGLSPLAQWLVIPALAFRSVWPRSAATGSFRHIFHHGDAR